MSDRPCSICSHPDRLAVDQAILNGKGLREVARDFGIGSGTPGTDTFRPDHKKVQRHRDSHLAQAYQAAREAGLVEAGQNLIQRMTHLDAVVDETLTRLRAGVEVTDEHGAVLDADGRPVRRYNETAILAAVREARRNVELHARLAGTMPEGDEDALDAARRALESPEARKAVADLEAAIAAAEGRQ